MITRLRVEDFQLSVDPGCRSADLALHDHTSRCRRGHANSSFQGFFRATFAIRPRRLVAGERPFVRPVFSGNSTITRAVFALLLPHSLDAIKGVFRFDSSGLRLDDVTAIMGGGRIQFGGRIGFEGYLPGELSVSARGTGMQLRYPEGVRSVVDADLTVRGNFKAPTLVGTVTVRNALWSRRIDPTGGLFDFGRSGGSAAGGVPESAVAVAATVPLRFDIQVQVPSTLPFKKPEAGRGATISRCAGTYDRRPTLRAGRSYRGEVISKAGPIW